MKVIEVRRSKKFKGAWIAFEDPGVAPAFATGTPKADAIRYATNRFGGASGEVHIYGADGVTIERSIVIDGRGQYPQVGDD